MNTIKNIALAAILPLVLAACGGGGGGGVSLQQKTATITFRTISSAHTAPLQGIQITAKLPAGATISDPSNALTGTSAGQVSALNYSVANQTATFGVLPVTPGGIVPFGPFAALKCDITPGVTLTESSFVAVNTPFPELLLSGQDSNGTTVNLVDEGVKVAMSVTFGYQ